MFHHHTNDNDLLYGHDCNISEVLHGLQLRQWIFPVSSGHPCEFPWWIIWLARAPFDKNQKRNYFPSFFLFQFLQLCSSQSSLRGHLKWAINFFLFHGKSQRHSSKVSCMAAQERWGRFLCVRRAETVPLYLSSLGRVMKDKLLPMACSP